MSVQMGIDTNDHAGVRGVGCPPDAAAAIVAGILAARALAEAGPARLPDGALLGLATGMEGHPDNVAACLGGGLTIAWTEDGEPRMARLEPAASIRRAEKPS